MTSLTPRMIREEISATARLPFPRARAVSAASTACPPDVRPLRRPQIGGDDLSAKKPQLRELVAMHTERFLAQEEAIAAQGAAPAARAAQGARAAPVRDRGHDVWGCALACEGGWVTRC